MTATLESANSRAHTPAPPHPQRSASGGRSRHGRTVRLYLVDAVIFAAFLLLMDVPLTGLAIHEWLGIAVGVGLTTHLVQHGGWIISTTRRLFDGASLRNRINYSMMIVLFAVFLTAILSGVMISEVVLPYLGIGTVDAPFWTWLHLVSVQVVLWLTALHIALNWKWIVSTTKRLFGRSGRPTRATP